MESFQKMYKAFSLRGLQMSENGNNIVNIGTTENIGVHFKIDGDSYLGNMKYYVARNDIIGMILFSYDVDIDITSQHVIEVDYPNSNFDKLNLKIAYKSRQNENGSFDYVIMLSTI